MVTIDENDALVGFGANDDVVAHVVIYASGEVVSEYTDMLATPEGREWLGRRLEQADRHLGAPESRTARDDDVMRERSQP
jgi:hypothetical protein